MTGGQREVPALPPEPPNGTVLRGVGTDVWLRADEENTTWPGAWFGAGVGAIYTWAEAFADGADPNARMVVVDPTDEQQVRKIADALSIEFLVLQRPSAGGSYAPIAEGLARAALRAVAALPPVDSPEDTNDG